jgi:hypothetical protein
MYGGLFFAPDELRQLLGRVSRFCEQVSTALRPRVKATVSRPKSPDVDVRRRDVTDAAGW